MFSNSGEGPTIYTNVHATLTSLVKKYLSKNSVRQNKVRTPFDPDNFIHLTMTSESQHHKFPIGASTLRAIGCDTSLSTRSHAYYCIHIMVSLIEPTKGPALLLNLLAVQLSIASDRYKYQKKIYFASCMSHVSDIIEPCTR